MRIFLRPVLLALFVTSCGGVAFGASIKPFYSEDFEGTIGPEWSTTATDVTPLGQRRFLGQFTNDAVSLFLSDIPSAPKYTVKFDLFVLNTWDGIGENEFGPDVWSLNVDGGSKSFDTTFSYIRDLNQSFPGSYPDSVNPAGTGASEVGTLGFSTGDDRPQVVAEDFVYQPKFFFAPDGNEVTITFSGSGLQEVTDESWGVDNVEVSAVPLPPTIMLLLTGLLGMATWLRLKPT